MEDNLEMKDMCKKPHELTDECIIAMKVFGKCRQQDCLKPDFIVPEPGVDSIPISGSYSGEKLEITAFIGPELSIAADPSILPTEEMPLPDPISPNSPIIFPRNLVEHCEIIDGSFHIAEIKTLNEQEQNLFAADGYWRVKIRYKFVYKLRLIDFAGNTLNIELTDSECGNTTIKKYILAYSFYEKQIVLFGGSANKDIVTSCNLFDNNELSPSPNAPYVFAQAKAMPLSVSIGDYIDPCDSLDSCPEKILGVTIGLFTIIKLFRLVNMTVLTTGRCDIPVCDPIVPGDPCSFFNEIPFPFDDFDPVIKE